jgi:hypothetical protein
LFRPHVFNVNGHNYNEFRYDGHLHADFDAE